MIDEGSDDVVACLEIRREVHCLIVPVCGVTTCWSEGNKRFIYIKLISVVTAHMNGELCRNRVKVQVLAEIIYSVSVGIGVRNRNPSCVP